jgi:hypothetical protein
MITVLRNLFVGIGALVIAVLLAAAGQGVLEYAVPSLSNRGIGATNVGTYALIVMLACVFFLVGVVAPRWLKTSAPLFWLLLPLVAVYLLAILGQPYVYRCNPLSVGGCWVIQSPFLVSAAAVVVGYLFGRRYGPSASV